MYQYNLYIIDILIFNPLKNVDFFFFLGVKLLANDCHLVQD